MNLMVMYSFYELSLQIRTQPSVLYSFHIATFTKEHGHTRSKKAVPNIKDVRHFDGPNRNSDH